MAVGSPPTVRRRQLGRELRRLREQAGLHGDQIAEQLRCSPSRISRIETARIRIPPGVVHEILDVLDIHDERRAQLIRLAREAERPGWWQEYTDVLSYEMSTYIAMEAEASRLRLFNPLLVPGALQTREYARAMLGKGPANEGETEPKLAARIQRQSKLLDRGDQVEIHVILDEAAVRRLVGGPEVMRAQLTRLLDVSTSPNVRFQIVPFVTGALAWPTGPFTIFDFPDSTESSVVYVENLTGDIYVERPSAVQLVAAVFDELSADALGPGPSRTLLGRIRAELGDRERTD